MKHCTFSKLVVVVAALAALLVAPSGPAAAAAFGTEFTYQGILGYGSGAANGSFDFRFILYTADSGGSQVGSTVVVDDLFVNEGRVVTTLDFGTIFTGDELWLEVSVREGSSTGGYTTLSPRQPLTAAPYAQHAATAAAATTATSAGNASQLNGQNPSYYLAWGNLTGVPADLSDGDDDTLAGLSCGEGQVVSWSGGAWACADAGVTLVSTFVVGPGGADAAANGTGLLAAVAALPTASETEPLLLKLEPGLYDLGAQQLVLPAWVDLEGSGRDVTTITSAIGGGNSDSTLVLSGGSEVRHLTVENSSTNVNMGVAVYVDGNNRLTDIHAVSTGDAGSVMGVIINGIGVCVRDSVVTILDGACTGNGTGIYVAYMYGGDVWLENVEISVAGGFNRIDGLLDQGLGFLTMRDVTVHATGSAEAYGVRVAGIFLSVTDHIDARNLVVEASTTGTTCVDLPCAGVYLKPAAGTDVLLDTVRVRATDQVHTAAYIVGGANSILKNADFEGAYYGLRVGDETDGPATASILGSRLVGGGDLTGIGMQVISLGGSAVTVDVNGSVIHGTVASVYEVNNGVTGRIGASMLAGGAAVGNFICAGVWDENYAFSSSTCP